MSGININLLPSDIIEQKRNEKNQAIKIRICIFILSVFIIISLSLILGRMVQNAQVNSLQNQLNSLRSEINNYKEQESYLTAIKKRLTLLQQIRSQESKQLTGLNLLTDLTQTTAQVSILSVDKVGKIGVGAISPSAILLQQLFDDLMDPKTNQDKIARVILNGVTKAGDQELRFDLQIDLK